MIAFGQIKDFYQKHLPQAVEKEHTLAAPCPLCSRTKASPNGTIRVNVNPRSYFRGYFSCTDHCSDGGYHFHFGRMLGLAADQIPGFDPDAIPYTLDVAYPPQHLETEMTQYMGLLKSAQAEYFARYGVSPETLRRLKVGFNGRYLVYPYIQETGLAYAARCTMPNRPEDSFWHGNEDFSKAPFTIFNAGDIDRCQGGALFVTETELNLLILRELGYPAISVPTAGDLDDIAPARLAGVEHLFLLVANTPEAQLSARKLAVRLGFKARMLSWPHGLKRGFQLFDAAAQGPEDAPKQLTAMIDGSTSFSPFASPQKERQQLVEFLKTEKGKDLLGLATGFPKLDAALDGLRGINILGGPPKVGKSSFFMQISTEVARSQRPVIYYDFENGRQKIYLRTTVRISGIPEKKIRTGTLDAEESKTWHATMSIFKEMLNYFKVVTDRELTPEVMRRHIDFLKNETRRDQLLVVLDSLHKLPFKDLSERRTGIDFWLRQLEAIRDEAGAHFLVISELTRGKGGGFGETPDLGSFKASGDIAYSADNAMVLMPDWNPMETTMASERKNSLWLVASREANPGKIGEYTLDYPYWRFREA